MNDMDMPREIRADVVTIEVTDKLTGRTLRRELPIDYIENSHALRLRGEDGSGRPSELVFLSDLGLAKLRDLTGGGADADPCGGHS